MTARQTVRGSTLAKSSDALSTKPAKSVHS